MWKKSKEENCFDRPNWLCKKTVNFIFNVQLFFLKKGCRSFG